MMTRTFNELMSYPTYDERLQYLMLYSKVGIDTFGFSRWINQQFYRSKEWKDIKRFVILRDQGCDLALPGYEIHDKIFVHHMNPLTITDIEQQTDQLLNPDYLVTVSFYTHNLIHYGNTKNYIPIVTERKPNDTCPWRM